MRVITEINRLRDELAGFLDEPPDARRDARDQGQGGDDAEHEQCDEHDRNRGEPVAGHGDGGDRDLRELDAPGDDRLVEAVRHLAAEAGQEEEWGDENRGRQRGQKARLGFADPWREQDQDRQRLFQEIVIEGAEKLAPEERCEASGGHQTPEHRGPLKA